MKAAAYAAGSAVCSLACLAGSGAGLIWTLFEWRSGLVMLLAAVVLGMAAKTLDRRKMRAIHGREAGDRLHDGNMTQAPLHLAKRDLSVHRKRERSELVGDVQDGGR